LLGKKAYKIFINFYAVVKICSYFCRGRVRYRGNVLLGIFLVFVLTKKLSDADVHTMRSTPFWKEIITRVIFVVTSELLCRRGFFSNACVNVFRQHRNTCSWILSNSHYWCRYFFIV